jgi:hypothetical protein
MKRKESHTQFFKSVKSVMAFSAYYTSLIDIANNCKFLDVRPAAHRYRFCVFSENR